METLTAKKQYLTENEAKVDFNDVYSAKTPHAYIATMAENGYEIGECARPFCCEAVKLLQEKNGVTWPTQLLDVGCSYGIGSAFVKYNCTFDELVAFFSSRAPKDYTTACEATRQWLNVAAPEFDVRCVGLDTSKPAIQFAMDAGLLDGGITCNFENNETPSKEDLGWIRGCNLLMTTGAIGYVTEQTLDMVLSNLGKSHPSCFGPIAVMTILRMFDTEQIKRCFERHGFSFCRIPDVRLPQRNFADEDERLQILSVLHDRKVDTTKWEDKGKLFADLYVAATKDEIEVVRERMIQTANKLSLSEPTSYIQR